MSSRLPNTESLLTEFRSALTCEDSPCSISIVGDSSWGSTDEYRHAAAEAITSDTVQLHRMDPVATDGRVLVRGDVDLNPDSPVRARVIGTMHVHHDLLSR